MQFWTYEKAKVEAGVLLVERWILARLRHRRFFSLTELNAAIGRVARRTERPAVQEARGLAPQLRSSRSTGRRCGRCPAPRYEYRRLQAGTSTSITTSSSTRHYYSVPHALGRARRSNVRITRTTVEVLFRRPTRGQPRP